MTRQPDPAPPSPPSGPSSVARDAVMRLDRTSFPAWRDRVAEVDAEMAEMAEHPPGPRSYPGYPSRSLPRPRRRLRPSLDRVMQERRSSRELDVVLPSASDLGRILYFGHGMNADDGRGPVPSAGGLQALELYLATFASSWLPRGLYHYDRERHALTELAAANAASDMAPAPDGGSWERASCERDFVPALATVSGGALLWIAVGDGARVRHKYGARADHFLALEAGHLMQNLCLLSATVGLSTVPLGGYYEHAIARALHLAAGDVVLYIGVCGAPRG